MKKIRTAIILVILSNFGFHLQAQTKYPAGVYMSLVELTEKKPSQHFSVKIEKRTQSDIAMIGGNDYKVISNDKNIKRKILKKIVWAVSDSSGFYLNCIHHKNQIGYAKVIEEKDTLLTFKAAIPNKEATKMTSTAGFLGGAVGGAVAGSKIAKMRYTYQLNTITGIVTLLDKD
jgi:hypothetical protein